MSLHPIQVTHEDIQHGWKGDCRRCPIARAIDRRLEKGYFAEVSDRIKIRKGRSVVAE